MKDFDDKDLVIVATFLLCGGALVLSSFFTVGAEAIQLTEKGLYGLFGVAVGKTWMETKTILPQ